MKIDPSQIPPVNIPLDRKSLEEEVSFLTLGTEKLQKKKKSIEKRIKRLELCNEFLGGILRTHSSLDIPKHDSKKSLYFFRDKDGKPVLVEELHPSPELMPEMRRIPLAQASTQVMKSGASGYIIQRVLFDYPVGCHELMIINFESNTFEKIAR